jgi:hypothetical protein
VPLGALGFPEGCNLWERQALGARRSFFTSDGSASLESLRHQKRKSIGRDAQCGVMVKPTPASSLIVRQSKLLLQFLVFYFVHLAGLMLITLIPAISLVLL